MSSSSSGFPLLEAKTKTPIAELSPELPDQSSRAVLGEVTLVWPYNAATKISAFLLAEPDVRLRRSKGQVRVQLQGHIAKAVSGLRLGGGDAVVLSLEGVDWVKDNSVVRVPGSRVEWQLQFAEKLVLQAKIGDDQVLQNVNVDHAEPEAALPPPTTTSIPPTAEDTQTAPLHANGEPTIPISHAANTELDEYPSPAFMKRARLSYGALFEGEDSKFEEDGGARGKGRKRTRFGRESSSWRYTSQSRSPTPQAESETPRQTAEAAVEADVEKPASPKPPMTDEGCQTMNLDMAPAQAKPSVMEAPSADEPAEEASADQPPSQAEDQPRKPSPAPDPQAPLGHQVAEPTRESPVSPPTKVTRVALKKNAPTASNTFGSSTLFGNTGPSQSGYDVPRFSNASAAGAGGGLGIENQVRFGFSHTPQTALPQPSQLSHSALAPQSVGQEDYPVSHLEPSGPTRNAGMETYVDQAEQEAEAEPQYGYNGTDLDPPAAASFGAGQWDMATQSQDYNPIEGGHFGTDALEEGTRITTGAYALHNDEIPADAVPPGFASFGGHEDEIDDEDLEEDDDEEQPHVPGEDFVENDELEDDLDDEVALEDRDETEYDPEGEIIEQGDYDQRQYNIPSDEESEEDEPIEVEASARDNEPDAIDEEELYQGADDQESYDEESDEVDEDQGSYDEDQGYDVVDEDQGSYDEEEGSSEVSEESYSAGPGAYHGNTSQTWASGGLARKQPMAPAAPQEPLVISLLSDSEDEDDGPPPQPVKTSTPVAAQPVQQDQTPSLQNLEAGDQHDAVLEPSPGPDQQATQDSAQGQTSHHAQMKSETGERRVSSGSHLYGESSEQPQDHSITELNLPSTPPPGDREAVAGADASEEEQVADNEDDSSYPIPSFNGASESRGVIDGSERPEIVSGSEPGQGSQSKTASTALPSAPDNMSGEGAMTPQINGREDGVTLGQAADRSAHHGLSDAARDQASSPPRPLAVSDEADATAESAGEQDDEVELLFKEEGRSTDQDFAMSDDQVDAFRAQDTMELPKSSPLPYQAAEGRGEHTTTGFTAIDSELDDTPAGQGELPNAAYSSPPRSQSFASQVLSSSPSKDGQTRLFPTPLESLPNQTFVPQSASSDTAQLLSNQQGGLEEAPVTLAESSFETRVHVEEQMIISEDERAASEPDVEMADVVAADQDVPPSDRDAEEMDIEDQIEAQLEVEIVQTTTTTTVQEGPDQLTVVKETRRVSVSHANGGDVSAAVEARLQDQDSDHLVEDIPIEPASLDDAIQEDLMLQDVVEEKLASEFGAQEDIVDEEDDVDMDDEVEADGSIDAEEVVEVADDVEEEDAGSGLPQDESMQGITAEVSAQEEPTQDDEASSQLGPEQPAHLPVVREEEDVGLVGEQDSSQQLEANDIPEVPVDEGRRKATQELEVLIRPQTRSRRARDQQLRSEEAASQENAPPLEPPSTKELSADVSKAATRSSTRSKRSSRAKEAVDPSIELARASIPKRGAAKKRPEPASTSPRHTRQMSISSQPTTAPSEADEGIDSSVALAKAVLESPSKKSAELPASANNTPPAVVAPSRAELVKRLRTPAAGLGGEFTPLKALRHHHSKKGHAHVLAVVACDPPEPRRTRHRDYHTAVTVTDASVAPDQAVEVQFSATHKVALPAAKQGDALVLRGFEIVALPGRGEFALRQRGGGGGEGEEEESSWAVLDADAEMPGGKGGPEFEMKEAVAEYLRDLQAWYQELDQLDREKLVTAVAKLAEAGHGVAD